MFLDEKGHVQWSGITEYSSLQELLDWQKQYGEGLPEVMKPVLENWIKIKTKFNEAKARGEVVMTLKTTSEGKVTEEKTVLMPEILRDKI